MFLCVACQQLQIDLSNFVIEENRSAITATPRDVMRITGSYYTGDSGHGRDDTSDFHGRNRNMRMSLISPNFSTIPTSWRFSTAC